MTVVPKQSSLYWFDPEPTKGSELRKVRPCIIASPDDMNENLSTILVVPLTSTLKPWPFRVTVTAFGKESSAACDQLRVIDKSRLRAYIGDLSATDRDKLYGLLQLIFSE
ncbi:MAG: type II toxin-antitoxin system PemK/MazF family toxin [Candidatus Saccharimonadales bacterium]